MVMGPFHFITLYIRATGIHSNGRRMPGKSTGSGMPMIPAQGLNPSPKPDAKGNRKDSALVSNTTQHKTNRLDNRSFCPTWMFG